MATNGREDEEAGSSPFQNAQTPLLRGDRQAYKGLKARPSLQGRLDRTSLAVPSPEPSSPNLTGWILLCVFTHILWGLYPVASRFLLTQPKQPLHAMRMITFVNAAAMLTLALFYTIPRMLCLKRPSPQTEDGPDAKVSTGEIVSGVLTMGISVSVLAAGTIIGSQFTSAYLVLLVFMCAPLFVSPLAYFVLRAPLSPLLIPTIAATLLGAGLVVYGGLTADPKFALGRSDFMGMAIALAGTLGQAVFIVWVQKTRAYIANDVVLYINYISMLSFAPAISFAAEPQDWGSVLRFNVLEWTYLVYLSIGVYCIGNLLQQMCVRKVGAPVFATLICVRLLASVVGSALLLDEQIKDVTEAIGCVVIVLAVTGYLVVQAFLNRQAQ